MQRMDCCYSRSERLIGKALDKYGRVLSRNPISAIIIAVLLNCLLGANLKWLETESEFKTLFLPSIRQATDVQQVSSLFPGHGETIYLHQVPDDGYYAEVIFTTPDNIISDNHKMEIAKFHSIVSRIKINSTKGEIFGFEDLCLRKGAKCLEPLYLQEHFLKRFKEKNITFPWVKDEQGYIHQIDQEFGNVEVQNGILKSAKALKIMYFLRQDTDEYARLSVKWENEFLKQMSQFNAESFNFYLGTSRSMETEVAKSTGWEMVVFLIVFLVMSVYSFLATASGNCLTQRGQLGVAGVLSSGMSVFGAFGLCSLIGVKYYNVIGVVPFYILGMGLHNVFIMLSGLSDAPLQGSVEERVGYTMKATGVTVTVSIITDLIVVLVGLMSNVEGARTLCYFIGAAILISYINHITFFLACISLHERRVASSRHCITCSVTYSKKEMKSAGYSNKLVLAWCSGKQATDKEDTQSYSDKFSARVFPKILLNFPVKIVVLVMFCAYLGFSIWGAINVKNEFRSTELLNDDSYYRSYRKMEINSFRTQSIPISFILKSDVDYKDKKVFGYVDNMIKKAKENVLIDNTCEINWLKEFYATTRIANRSKAEFSNQVKSFLQQHPMYRNDVVFDQTGTKIKMSRISVLGTNMKSNSDQESTISKLREIAAQSPISSVVHAPEAIHDDDFIPEMTKMFLIFVVAFLVCVAVTCFLMPHVLLMLIIVLSTASITVGVFGFMSICGISLNPLTCIFVVLSLGFSFNFSTYVCHSFMLSDILDRTLMINSAIVRTAGPMISSAIASILCIIYFAFSRSEIFQSFFQIILIVVLLATVHGLFILPVILSLIGPIKSGYSPVRTSSTKAQLIQNRSSTTWSINNGGIKTGSSVFKGPRGQFNLRRLNQ